MKTGFLLRGAALAALATMVGAGAANAQAPQTTTAWSGAPRWTEGDQQFKVRGRVHYDISTVETDFDTGTDENFTRTGIRRAHFGVEGRFTRNWRYRAEFVLNPSQSDSSTTNAAGEVGVDDFYIEYASDTYSLTIGEQNVTSPLEDRTSSNTTQFNERSAYINAFGFGRAAGVAFVTNGGNWSLAGGVYGDSLNNAEAGAAASEIFSVSTRGAWAPLYEQSPEGLVLLHLGASARFREAGDTTGFSYSVRPALARGGATPLNFGVSGQSDTTYGLEAAFQYHQFGVEAAYSYLSGETFAGAEYDLNGYYVDLFFSLTGESRAYNATQGNFGRINPRRPVGTDGGFGHWMLAARYDHIELDDPLGGASRGEQSSYIGGIQWNPIGYVTFRLNYGVTEFDRFTASDGESEVISFRSQFDF